MTNRFLDLTEGVAMLVTDLHGDRDAYQRYISRFRRLHAQGTAQRLILLGDLIHSESPPHQDQSLEMVLDVIALRRELGPDAVIMLLGNHEMPHIYGVTLSKGDIEYTPRFEHALGAHRAEVLAFLTDLPFYARTGSGVLLAHAGPAPAVANRIADLQSFDHHAILREADHVLAESPNLDELYARFGEMYGETYADMAFRYLAIRDPLDPRYSHLLRSFMISHQSRQFELLWDALFSRNEQGLSEPVYLHACEQFLTAMSAGAPAAQRVIVSGHISTNGGHAIINRFHLRLASAAHARPRAAAQYLLLDCAAPVDSPLDLLPHLDSVFDEDL